MYVDDLTRVHHMHDAACEAVHFAEGKTRRALDENRQLALALVKCIEIVGEAAAGVTQEFRERHAEIPWSGIVAMRNRLIHGYFDIDLDRVWDTVTSNLPPLLETLERMLEREAGS